MQNAFKNMSLSQVSIFCPKNVGDDDDDKSKFKNDIMKWNDSESEEASNLTLLMMNDCLLKIELRIANTIA